MDVESVIIRFSGADELGIYTKCKSVSDAHTILNDIVIGSSEALGED